MVAEKAPNKEQTGIIMSIIKYSSKIYQSILYNKTINDAIYCRRWRETIERELQNLKNY